MTQVLSVLAVVLLAAFLMPLAVRSLRRRRRGGGGLGGAFLSLEAVVRPAAEHVIEAKRETPKGAPENGEPPTGR
jgi:hypothetical protein